MAPGSYTANPVLLEHFYDIWRKMLKSWSNPKKFQLVKNFLGVFNFKVAKDQFNGFFSSLQRIERNLNKQLKSIEGGKAIFVEGDTIWAIILKGWSCLTEFCLLDKQTFHILFPSDQ